MSDIAVPIASRQDDAPRARKRAEHCKSVIGCANCKQRHLKCDEKKPTCTRCQRLGEICQWFSTPRPKFRAFKVQTPKTMRVASLNSTAAVDAFEFFDLYTLPVLRECHPSILWRSTFGFLVQSSVSFRKIATALGFQHRLLNCEDESAKAQILVKANESYAEALRSLRLSIRHSNHTLAISFGCMLLVLLSSLREARSDFLVHLACGMGIMKKMNLHMKSLGEVRGIYTILQHYCVNSWLYSCSPLFEGRAGEYMETLELDDNFYWDNLVFEVPSLELSCLIAGVMHIYLSPDSTDRRLTRLQRLKVRTTALAEALEKPLDEQHASNTSFAVLKASVILYETSLDASIRGEQPAKIQSEAAESALDYIESALSKLNKLGRGDCHRAQLFSVDLGIIQSLDLIATKSKSEAARLRAISLFELCPKVEGMWIATKTAIVMNEGK